MIAAFKNILSPSERCLSCTCRIDDRFGGSRISTISTYDHVDSPQHRTAQVLVLIDRRRRNDGCHHRSGIAGCCIDLCHDPSARLTPNRFCSAARGGPDPTRSRSRPGCPDHTGDPVTHTVWPDPAVPELIVEDGVTAGSAWNSDRIHRIDRIFELSCR